MTPFLLVCGALYYLLCLWWTIRTGRFLWAYWRFWRAERRDLYFIPRQERASLLGTNLGAMVVALVWMIGPFLVLQNNAPAWGCAYLYFGLIAGFVIAFFLFPLLPVHPPWVQRFEQNRSPEDIERIQGRGQALLQENPQAFLNAIRTQEGWDLWVMTVV
jgi:hypothetical protein